MLWVQFQEGSWSNMRTLPQMRDDAGVLKALSIMWDEMCSATPPRTKVMRVGTTLCDLTPADTRQLDFLIDDDSERQKWERIGDALDALNVKYGKTVASVGHWAPPAGGNVGGKISFTRIPSAEDFW